MATCRVTETATGTIHTCFVPKPRLLRAPSAAPRPSHLLGAENISLVFPQFSSPPGGVTSVTGYNLNTARYLCDLSQGLTVFSSDFAQTPNGIWTQNIAFFENVPCGGTSSSSPGYIGVLTVIQTQSGQVPISGFNPFGSGGTDHYALKSNNPGYIWVSVSTMDDSMFSSILAPHLQQPQLFKPHTQRACIRLTRVRPRLFVQRCKCLFGDGALVRSSCP